MLEFSSRNLVINRFIIALQDVLDHFCGMYARLFSPSDGLGWPSLQVFFMGSRAVFIDGAEFALTVKPGMAGDTFALVQYFHCGAGEAHIYPSFDQPVGDAVVIFLDLNMIVYV